MERILNEQTSDGGERYTASKCPHNNNYDPLFEIEVHTPNNEGKFTLQDPITRKAIARDFIQMTKIFPRSGIANHQQLKLL